MFEEFPELVAYACHVKNSGATALANDPPPEHLVI